MISTLFIGRNLNSKFHKTHSFPMLDLPSFQRACRDREKSLIFVFRSVCIRQRSGIKRLQLYIIKVSEYVVRLSLAHTYTHKRKCLRRRKIPQSKIRHKLKFVTQRQFDSKINNTSDRLARYDITAEKRIRTSTERPTS